jgi:prophage endopeptidase
LQLETLARASEQSHSVAQAAISTTYQKDLQNAEIRRQKDIAAARTGALRLFDPGAQGACAGGASQDATSAGGRDGGPDTGLSSQSVEFLLTEADRADGIARQLGACQAVIVSDRVP